MVRLAFVINWERNAQENFHLVFTIVVDFFKRLEFQNLFLILFEFGFWMQVFFWKPKIYFIKYDKDIYVWHNFLIEYGT